MSEYKRLTEKAVRNLKGNNYPQEYYDIYNRLAELEDKIENGDLVFVPKCRPEYSVEKSRTLNTYFVVKWKNEPSFDRTCMYLKTFRTEEQAEKFLEELKKNG